MLTLDQTKKALEILRLRGLPKENKNDLIFDPKTHNEEVKKGYERWRNSCREAIKQIREERV